MSSKYRLLLNAIQNDHLAMLHKFQELSPNELTPYCKRYEERLLEHEARLAELIGPHAHILVRNLLEAVTAKFDAHQVLIAMCEKEERMRPFLPPRPVPRYKHPCDDAQIGDTLIYKLRPSQQPGDPDKLWHGRILEFSTPPGRQRVYYVDSLEFPGSSEIVYSSQAVDYEPASPGRDVTC